MIRLFAKLPKPESFNHIDPSPGILVTVLIYASLAGLWILFSDQLLGLIVSNPDTLMAASSLKGFIFVFFTSLLLYWVLRRAVGKGEPHERDPAERQTGLFKQPSWFSYATTVVLCVLALLFRQKISVTLANRPLLIFMVLPIILSAVLGGFGPGLFATVLITLATAWFIPPEGSFTIAASYDIVQWGMLIFDGLLISLVSEIMHRARHNEANRVRQLLTTQDTLRDSETRYRNLFEAANVGKTVRFPSGEFEVNKAFCDLLGYEKEELRNKPWQDLTPPADIGPISNLLSPLLKGEKDSVRFEKRYIHKNGLYVWADVSVVILRDADKNPLYFITTMVDITKRKRFEEDLRASEEKFLKAFRLSPDAITLTAMADGKLVDVNNSLLRLTGFDFQETIGKTTAELKLWVDTSDRKRYVELLEKDGGVRDLSAEFRTKSGEIRTCLVSGEVLELQGEKYILGIIRDITEQKLAERSLKDSEGRLRNLFNQATDGIYLLTPDHRYIDANPAGLNMLGYNREELLGLGTYDVLAEHERGRLDLEVPVMMAGTPHLAEWIHLRKDGSTFPAEVSALPISKTEYFAIVRDLTERKHTEKELDQYRKHLEDLVKNRTAELEEKIAEIERMNRIFVDRELRMVELKEKIRDLEVKNKGPK